MSVANVLCVPLGTFLANLSWRIPFCLSLVASLSVLWFVWRHVPDVGSVESTRFRSQFAFLRNREPWLILMMTMMGNCGIFCWYSYVGPTFQAESGFSANALPLLMVVAGLGMVIGNLLGGRLSDSYPPARVVMSFQLMAASLLALIACFAYNEIAIVPLAFLVAFALFAVGGPQQLLIIKYSQGGELLGGATVQIAFNLGNAIGAFCGGLPIDAGYHVASSAWVGVPIVLLGALSSFIFLRATRRFS